MRIAELPARVAGFAASTAAVVGAIIAFLLWRVARRGLRKVRTWLGARPQTRNNL